jgi:hypothetical protein
MTKNIFSIHCCEMNFRQWAYLRFGPRMASAKAVSDNHGMGKVRKALKWLADKLAAAFNVDFSDLGRSGVVWPHNSDEQDIMSVVAEPVDNLFVNIFDLHTRACSAG